jgi:GcrA cell cycle regulator
LCELWWGPQDTGGLKMDGAWTLLEPIPAAQTEALIIQAEIETPDSLPAECKAPEAVLIEIQSVPEQLSEEPAAEPAAEPIETWTPERIEALTRLWEEGVTTAEIGRRIGVTKNAVIGKVHRIGLTPRVITQKPPPRRNVFDFTGPACMWPVGHPGEDDFHFCGEHPVAGKPYCEHHVEVAYIKPKDKSEAA